MNLSEKETKSKHKSIKKQGHKEGFPRFKTQNGSCKRTNLSIKDLEGNGCKTDAEYQQRAPAILHCFTGTIRDAERVLERGWYLSLSGIVTFKKSETLREVAKMAPLNQLLIETDTPYLSPQ